jgi:hypothetical protein
MCDAFRAFSREMHLAGVDGDKIKIIIERDEYLKFEEYFQRISSTATPDMTCGVINFHPLRINGIRILPNEPEKQ